MLNLFKKIFKKYSEFILKLITFIGLTITYIIGISLGFLIFKLKNNKNQNTWHKFNQNINSKYMY